MNSRLLIYQSADMLLNSHLTTFFMDRWEGGVTAPQSVDKVQFNPRDYSVDEDEFKS